MIRKLLGLLLAVSMILSAVSAFAEDEPAADAPAEVSAEETAETAETADPVLLATVNGKEIFSDNADIRYWISYYLYQLANSGYDTSDEELLNTVNQYAMLNAQRLILIGQKAEEMGLAGFTDEETAAIEAEAKQTWEDNIASLIPSTITDESSEDDKAAARADAEAELLADGYTEESYIAEYVEGQKSNELINRLRDVISADLKVTDEDVQAHFDGLVKEDEEMYSEDIGSYEFYTQYYQQESYYTPEGYRGVIHILLKADDELMNTWKDLSARYEEQQEAEEAEAADDAEPAATDAPEETAETDETPAPTAEPVTEEMVNAAKQAVLDSVQDKVDEINQKLKDGASFTDLIKEYGNDPGMQNESLLESGYLVHKESILWDPAFTAGAMSLEKVGDWSDPILGSSGVHIIYYLRDVPGGAAELTDQLKEEIRAELLDEQKDAALNDAMEQWLKEAEIVYTDAGASWEVPEAEATDGAAEETAAEGGAD